MRRLIVLAFVIGCGTEDPPPRVDPPAAPSENDPDYQVDMKTWYLVGNELTPGGDTLEGEIDAPDGTRFVDMWLDGAPGVRLERDGQTFTIAGAIGALTVGDHEVLFAADGADTAFARLDFHRSHPLYVLASTDWDYADAGDLSLDFQIRMKDEHPGVRVTNFIGPYTFTDPEVTDEREAELIQWVLEERDQRDGEIALHIHPYCNFVEYAGLTCNTDDSMTNASDPSGYSVGLWAYGETDFGTLLDSADQLFVDHGWEKPVTFRAGGWTATIDTLRALADHGYVADTSANNWARMEEWNRPLRGTLYEWNMANWVSIGDTSQPYYPNDGDVLSDEDPTLTILEVPDNAIMADYVTVEEMTEIFDLNWDGTPLEQPVTYMMGWHPSPNLPSEYMNRVDGFLDLADLHLASNGDGPVVYEVLKNMPIVFPR